MEEGDLLQVFTSTGELLGTGYFNRRSKIIGRMVAFDQTAPLVSLKQKLDAAIALRKNFIHHEKTNAYRLVNAEGDAIPGLVIDVYDRLLVLQSSTLGMDRLKSWIVDYLVEKLQPLAIYEKSIFSAAKKKGYPSLKVFYTVHAILRLNFARTIYISPWI